VYAADAFGSAAVPLSDRHPRAADRHAAPPPYADANRNADANSHLAA